MAQTPLIRTKATKALFWNIWGVRHPEALNRYTAQQIASGMELAFFTEVTDTDYDESVPLVHTSTRMSEPPSYLDGLARIRMGLPKRYEVCYETAERRTWRCRVENDVAIPNVGFGSALIYDTQKIKPVEIGAETILAANIWGIRPRTLQWIVFQKGTVTYLAAHLHGAWIAGNTKGDHPARLQQSTEVTMTLAELSLQYAVDKVVFGGDLNLDLNTHALRILESGESVTPALRLRNLIREFDIINTRTPEYRSYYDENGSRYADYVLVGSNVAVHDFWVLNRTTISDHAPLHLTFS